jgi:hypothetical protein
MLDGHRGEPAGGPGEHRRLAGQLSAGVSGADDDECATGVPLGPVVGQLGRLDVPDEVVAQVERLRDAPEAVRDAGHAGDRRQLVHAADRDDQAVVVHVVVVHVPVPPLGVRKTRQRK